MAPMSMNRRTLSIGSALSLATFGWRPALPVLAQATPTTTLPALKLVAKDFAFDMPSSIPSGFTTITMENHGAFDHHANFLKLHDGVTIEQAAAAETEQDLARIGEFFGGPLVAPGTVGSTVIDLVEGTYAVLCMIVIPDGIPHYHKGMIAPLTVTAGASAGVAPKADLTIDLMEMMFHELPDSRPTGPQVWEIRNVGTTIHELVVFKLDDGITPEQVIAMLLGPPPAATPGSTPVAPSGPPPFTSFGATSFMSPGCTNYATLDLVTGAYLAICFWHDAQGEKSHAELGMIHTFTVA